MPPADANAILRIFPFILAFILPLSMPANSLKCYECFDRSQPCTRASNCSGSACVLYENMPNRTSVAFCLLATAEREDTQMTQGCWRDNAVDSAGVECLCTSDFCNAPRDLWTSDPNSPPIAGLKMLDKNPFVDYEYLDEEKAMQKEVKGANEIGELMDDPELPAEGDEQDLMPKDFDDYLDWERRTRNRNQTPKEDDEEGGNQTASAAAGILDRPEASMPTTMQPSEGPSSAQPIEATDPLSTFSPVENAASSPNHRFSGFGRQWPHSTIVLFIGLIPTFIFSTSFIYSYFH